MKYFLATLLIFCFGLRAAGQKPQVAAQVGNADKQNTHNKIQQEMLNRGKYLLPFRTMKLAAKTLPMFYNGQAVVGVKQVLGTQLSQRNRPPSPKHLTNGAFGNSHCYDTGFARLIRIHHNAVLVNDINHISTGNLIAGSLFNNETMYGQWHTNGVLIKTDDYGNLIWSKLWSEAVQEQLISIIILRTKELANNDILAIATVEAYPDSITAESSPQTLTSVLRLSPTGDIRWYKLFKTPLSIANAGISVDIENVTENTDGHLILTGTTITTAPFYRLYATVMHLDQDGNKLWDNNITGNIDTYNYMGSIEGLNSFMNNGKIMLVAVPHGGDYGYYYFKDYVGFYTLDYNTGNVIAQKYVDVNKPETDTLFTFLFSYYYNNSRQLANGHTLVWGQLYTGYLDTSGLIPYYGVLEFDQQQYIVNAYTISSTIRYNYYYDQLQFDANGNGLLTMSQYLNSGPYTENVFLGSIKNNKFVKQRMASYNDIGLTGYNDYFSFLKDSGYIFCQSYFVNGLYANSYIEFKKMYDTDTSSLCLGTDSAFATISSPLTFLPDTDTANYSHYLSLYPNLDSLYNYSIAASDTLVFDSLNECLQRSNCDTLNINGKFTICGTSQAAIFTAHKNPLCGATVNWQIDTTAIDTLAQINDTTIAVYFKNNNWQGKLYASIAGGGCSMPLLDSAAIHITVVPQLNLGPDTALCIGDTIRLDADSGFATYKWQDGSADSFFLASKPGQYYVSVTDFCGQQYSDTINITKAVYYFSIGNDTSICVGDTVTLTATQGFTSYRWRPAGSISADTGYTIKAYPVVSTAYTASAEKQPGCFVYDTVKVTVLSAPPINLGNDTSICAGGQVTLNAGADFATYVWSNGAVTPQIVVTQPGTYLVKATAINGCSTLDSFMLLRVYPLPLFTLGNKDTAICQGENVTYQFNLPGATYAWNDGNTVGTEVITQPGTYWLKVTQNGCSSADTVILAVNPSPVVMLGNDTILCAGGSKVLSAFNAGAAYVWQNGSTGPTYTVVQAGVYFVTADINGCTAGDTINIGYLSPPVFNLGRDTFLCTGTTILLNPTLNTPVSYVWQDGSTATSYMVQTPGTFYLTASNQCGSVTDSINITIGVCKLLMPSAFTPNGDGINDVFKVKYPFPVKKFNFVVFNRWGQKMFETNDIGQGWDGTFNGFAQPLGTYIWEISLIDGQGVAQTAKGTITIIR